MSEDKEVTYDKLYGKEITNNESRIDKKSDLIKRGIIEAARTCHECKFATAVSDSKMKCTVLDLIMNMWETCSQFQQRKK